MIDVSSAQIKPAQTKPAQTNTPPINQAPIIAEPLNAAAGLRVLVTGIGGPAGRALAAQLVRSGAVTFGVDMVAIDLADVQTFRVPPAADVRLLPALRRIIRDQRIDVVLPTVSEELTLIASVKAELGAEVVIADPHSVWLANDKLMTMLRLASRGVSIPRYGTPGDFRDAEDALRELGTPMIMKPRVSRGGRGVVVVTDPSQVDWVGVEDTHILQEFAAGQEYAPVVFGTRDASDTAFVVVLEKTGLAAGNVGNATGVRRVETGDHDDVAELARATVEALDLVGPVDIDIRRLADGQPVVLEVNARFGANSEAAPELMQRVLSAAQRSEKSVRAVNGAVK